MISKLSCAIVLVGVEWWSPEMGYVGESQSTRPPQSSFQPQRNHFP